MIKKEIKERIEKLKKLIEYHRYLYHVLDKQEISEAALDSLKKELFDLEQKFPEFITSDSPTQRISGKPLEKFEKNNHPKPMLSFNDAFSEQDIKDWITRNSKLLTKQENEKIDFYCEPKMDGLAIELIYENGFFKTGLTRGDGIVGENVTQNLKTIESIPLKINEDSQVVVRGEVIISKKNFEKINKEQIRKNLPVFANPRNLAAGSIRQLDPQITKERLLDMTAYSLISDFNQKNHEQEHQILHNLGFKTNNKYCRYCKNLNEVFDFYNFLLKQREKLPYEIDGIVVQINDKEIFEKLGTVGKAPRAAIAFKFPLKETTTIVEDIKIQVGRTGVLTPVAILKPVKLGGVLISRATLHNEDEIKKLGIMIGDTVIVGRAGDVIPEIRKVLTELRTGQERFFQMPKNCPSCNTKIIKTEEKILRCPNPKCFAQKRRYFYHFISKNAFDIKGLGTKIIDRFIDQGLVFDPSDLFKLKQGDISIMERFGEKSAKNLISTIQSHKKIPLAKFIYALGIRNVGEETSRDLEINFGSVDKLKQAKIEELEKIIDIGPKVSQSIYQFFHEKKNLDFIKKLKRNGVKIITDNQKIKNKKLKGLKFVLTGKLETMTREQAKEKIRLLGGEISELVSKKTNYVVIGEDPGSKFDQAKKLGIKILTEKDLLEIFNQ